MPGGTGMKPAFHTQYAHHQRKRPQPLGQTATLMTVTVAQWSWLKLPQRISKSIILRH